MKGSLGMGRWPRKPSLLWTDKGHMPQALSSQEVEKEKQKVDNLKTCQQFGKSQRSQKAI